MSLDLSFDDGQLAIIEALDQFCRDQCDDERLKAIAGTFPAELWFALAELGVLAAGDPAEEGGALEVCAAMESLGRALFPGPLCATYLALNVLPEAERAGVADGAVIVSAGQPPLLPYAPCATIFLEIDGERVYRATPKGEIETVGTLGGEPWGRVALERDKELQGATRGLALSELALAGYLAAAGDRLVADACEHARTRQQFGRSIGEFQAVAHPLADCSMRLAAARILARSAAWHLDDGEIQRARSSAAAARLSASGAALEAAHVCHQVFGAIGITLEGPAYHVSRRIRQLASQPPGAAASRAHVLAQIGLGETTPVGVGAVTG
jgi:alkylation response protein AidB-like acyl-CoA dehydrogenase